MLRRTRIPFIINNHNTIIQKQITNNVNVLAGFTNVIPNQQQQQQLNFTPPTLISTRRFVAASTSKISKDGGENNNNTTTKETSSNIKEEGSSTTTTTTNQQQQPPAQQQFVETISTAIPAAATQATSQFKKFVHTWQLGILGGIGLCMGVGTMFYVFWQPFRSDATLQGTEVASNVLSDARVREGAVQITKEVVESVLKDPSSVDLLVGVLTRLLQQEGTKVATIIYLEELFNDPLTQDLAKRLIIDVARDDWTKDSLSEVARGLVLDLLKEPIVKKSLTDLLLRSATDALRNEELQRTTSQSVRRTVAGVVIPWS